MVEHGVLDGSLASLEFFSIGALLSLALRFLSLLLGFVFSSLSFLLSFKLSTLSCFLSFSLFLVSQFLSLFSSFGRILDGLVLFAESGLVSLLLVVEFPFLSSDFFLYLLPLLLLLE